MSTPITRRQLIKILAAATGTAMLSSVPNKWKTPVVEVGVLPAHAQGSLATGTITGHVYNGQSPLTAPNQNPKLPAPTPVANATVSVDGKSLSGLTDNNGFYSIPNVPAGTWNLTCTNVSQLYPNPDYLTGVVVTAGGTSANNDFYLNLG